MSKYIKSLTLDISGAPPRQRITAKQGDVKSRFLKITLADGETKVVLDDNENADFRCIKPDDTSCILPSTKEADGTILVELDKQVLAVAGEVRAEVVISNESGMVLSTTYFFIDVEPAATNGNYTPSTTFQKFAREIDMNGYGIRNLPIPSENGDAVNKGYVDEKLKNVKVPVDSALDENSINAIQNAVVAKEFQGIKNTVNGVNLTYNNLVKPSSPTNTFYFKDGVNLPALHVSFHVPHHTFTYDAETGEADITWERTNLPPCEYSFDDGRAYANFKCDFTEAYILLDVSVLNPEASGVYPMPLTEINSACEEMGGFLVFERTVYSPMTSSQLTWQYNFRFVFPDEATRDAFNEELMPVIRNGWRGFAESYTYIPATEEIVSEVIANA